MRGTTLNSVLAACLAPLVLTWHRSYAVLLRARGYQLAVSLRVQGTYLQFTDVDMGQSHHQCVYLRCNREATSCRAARHNVMYSKCDIPTCVVCVQGTSIQFADVDMGQSHHQCFICAATGGEYLRRALLGHT
jgi:hypothetical protein